MTSPCKTLRSDRKPVFSVTLDDCVVQDFTSGGKGGQNQDKRHTGIRIIHPPSGARGECREERSQLQNKKIAFRRMAEHPKFKFWLHQVLSTGPTPEQRVEKDMDPANIRVDIKDNEGRWVIADEDSIGR